jgi:diacylglycerol kinase (ATP)
MSKKNNSKRVKLIANLSAGKASDAEKKLNVVILCLENLGIKADVALAKPKEKATSIASQAVKDGYKTVIAMGGDGTIEAVMRGLVGSKVHLGIIPAGTENNIAKSLGIPLKLEEACSLINSDTAEKLDVGQVKTRKGKKFTFFEMASVGLSAAMYPSSTKVAGGKISAIKDAVMVLVDQDTRPKVSLKLDDESKIEVETMSVMVSNTPVFGKKFLVAPNASLQDGLLDISVYQDFSKAELLGYYAKVMDGGYSGNGKVQRYQARKLKVRSSPRQKVMADGVELGKGPVTIKMLPGALRVITAQKSPGLVIRQEDGSKMTPVPVPTPVENNHHNKIRTLLR